jgi:transcriptional regulator with XRE-family HTH domain
VTVSERFGRNLARLRREAGLSQGEVGERASLHPTAVGLIERGERTARLDTLVKLAGALEVEPNELLRGIGWKPGRMLQGRFDFEDAS